MRKTHPSHRFEHMASYDVIACARCYAEPWWPIAEQRCSIEGASRESDSADEPKPVGRGFKNAEDERIVEALRGGMSARAAVKRFRTSFARVASLSKLYGVTK